MFLGVLTGSLLQVCVEGFDTARESRSVVFLAERLEYKFGFFALVRQLEPHVFLVAFRRNAGGFIWGGWIQDRVDEHFARFLAQT